MNTTNEFEKSVLKNNSLAIERVEQIERDLRAWAVKPIEFSFNPAGTHLFSMMELAHSYARRCVDFIDAIRTLIAQNRIVPATVLGRALIETIAMGCLYIHDMQRLIAAGDRVRVGERLSRFYSGFKGQAVEPVHVMDAMRHLETIDGDYVAYLDRKYGAFTRFLADQEAAGVNVGGKSMRTSAQTTLQISAFRVRMDKKLHIGF